MPGEPIYVSRKGTASTSIDDDPAFPAIYRARERWRQQRRELAALVVFAVALVSVGAAIFGVMRFFVR